MPGSPHGGGVVTDVPGMAALRAQPRAGLPVWGTAGRVAISDSTVLDLHNNPGACSASKSVKECTLSKGELGSTPLVGIKAGKVKVTATWQVVDASSYLGDHSAHRSKRRQQHEYTACM